MPTAHSFSGRTKHVTRINMPTINYYSKEIQQCQEMYDRLHLDKDDEKREPVNSAPFPLLRGHTMITQTRPLTYSLVRDRRPYSMRSAPVLFLKEDSILFDDRLQYQNISDDKIAADDSKSDNSDYECDENGHGRKRSRLDPEQLCKYLSEKGFGLPSIVKSHSTYRRISQQIPRGMRCRPLPRNPSKREKIKGRARLDQELANMKAIAFCEQQAPKAFRTASANMKNRDVQFVEDDFREHMQREGFDVLIDEDFDDDDGNASIVRMPVKQEDLFVRINTWVTEVESSCKVYINSGQNEDTSNVPTEHLVQSGYDLKH